MIQRNFKLCDVPVHSVCFLQNFFFRSEQKFLPVLYHRAKFYNFTVNFQRYFRSKYKFCKIFECTRSLDLHLREPGVLARARAISCPGHARQETISSHLGARGLGRWLRVLARAHQAHAGANLAILYTRKFCKTYVSKFRLRKKSVRSKQNERENRIIWNFSETFLQNFLKIGSLVDFNVQNNFWKIGKHSPYKFYGK